MFPWPFEHQVCRRVVGRKSGLLFHSCWERNDPGLRRWIDKGTGNLGWFYVLETEMKWSHNDPKHWSSCKMTPGVRGSQVEMSNSRASRGDSKTLTSFPCCSPTLHRPNSRREWLFPPLPGPSSCCFHCKLPAKAICLASTWPVWRSGPHRGQWEVFLDHLTHSLYLFVFTFLFICPSEPPFLSGSAAGYLKQGPAAGCAGRCGRVCI